MAAIETVLIYLERWHSGHFGSVCLPSRDTLDGDKPGGAQRCLTAPFRANLAVPRHRRLEPAAPGRLASPLSWGQCWPLIWLSVRLLQCARFQTTTMGAPPADGVGFEYFSSSPLIVTFVRFCSVPFQFGNELPST